MAMVINSNIMSLNAQRNLMGSQGDLNTAMERLSSGLRINSAADDAAGLAISSRFDSQVRGLNQAIRNANDGISLINTAEGALQEGTNILQRMRELAIQSANGIYSDENRASLNAEVEQLKAELTRIAETTSFNGLKILDGTLGDIDLQVGASAFENITLNVGSGYTAEALGAADGGVSSGSFTLAEVASVGQSGSSGTLEALGTNDLEINGVSIPAATGSFDTVSSSDNTASALAIANAINSVSDETGVVAEATNSISLGTISGETVYSLGVFTNTNAALASAGDLVINGADVQFDPASMTVQDAVDAINADLEVAGTDPGVRARVDSLGTGVELYSTGAETISLSSDGTPATAIFAGFDTSAAGTDTQSMTDDLLTGELVINGTNIIGDFAGVEGLADLINESSATTGVVATVDSSSNLVLTAEDGRNIQLASDGKADIDLTNADLNGGADIDNTYAGSVTLRSNEAIEIGGNDPSALGFTAGATEASTTSALQETAGTAASARLDVTGAAVSTFGAGDLTLNGVDLLFGFTTTNTGTSATELAAAINAVTEQTGVSAEVDPADANEVILTTGIGGEIVFTSDAGNDTTNVIALDSADGLTNIKADITATTTAAQATVTSSGTDATFDNMVNGDLTINGYTVDFTNAASLLSTDNERSTVDPTASAQFTALAINNTEGLSDQLVATAYTEMNLGEVQAGSADDQFTLIVNGLVVDIDNPIVDDDANGNIAGTLNGAFAEAASLYDADPVANAAYADAAGLLASVNDAGELIITANDGRNITVSVGGTANGDSLLSGFDVTAAGSVTAKGTISLEANDGFTVGEIGGDRRTLAGIEEAGGSVADINISTQRGANEAIDIIDRAIDEINSARGDLGAASNRLDFTINNLSNVVENAAAARSRIQDADFAAESAALSRAQVLQQAGTAMLAQANAQPQQVLSLLQ